MKTEKELQEIKTEVETENEGQRELTEEELEQVTGGLVGDASETMRTNR